MADVFTVNAEGFLEITKHPRADLVYTLDLEPYVGTEALVAATWSVITTGVTLVQQGVTGKKTSVRLSGGVAGRRYRLLLTWTFGADSRVDARDVYVTVKPR